MRRLVSLCLLLPCCASLPAPAPCWPISAPQSTAARTLWAQYPTPAQWTAEVRFLVARQDGQRYRGTASLAVRQPDHLRLDVLGPHGGVLVALASDGNCLQVLDGQRGSRRAGPASAAQLDAWLEAPLGISVEDLVRLLGGRLQLPESAALCRSEDQLRARWQGAGQHYLATFAQGDGALLRLERADLPDASPNATLSWAARRPDGLATELHGELHSTNTVLHWQAKLRDVQVGAELPDGAFVIGDLPPAAGK